MLENARVLVNELLCEDTYSITLQSPNIARAARAGQILHAQCEGLVLRRPFGICDADKNAGTLRFCFEVRGAGTKKLALLKEGDSLSLNGAVGHGFDALSGVRTLVVGGGIGVFPLLFAAKVCGNASALLAFRTRERMVLTNDFGAVCDKVSIATDDGSFGFHGYADVLLRSILETESYERICVCGPFLMMKAVSKVAAEHGILCEVSLEERMGCGVGACLACVCETTLGKKRVCIDGPVFDAKDVRWDA